MGYKSYIFSINLIFIFIFFTKLTYIPAKMSFKRNPFFLKVSITPEIIHFMCLFFFYFVTYTQLKTFVGQSLSSRRDSLLCQFDVLTHRVNFTIDATLLVCICVCLHSRVLQNHVYTLVALDQNITPL